jgi:hypothetical protein
MKRSLLCFIGGVSLLWAGIANAAPPHLKGKYAFTGTESGILDSEGFNDNLTPKSEDAYGFDRSLQGVATFNRDGTGTVEGKAVGNTEPEGGANSWSENFSYNFTYAVDKDGNITMALDDSYTGTFTAGTLKDKTYTLDKLSLSGMASNNNSVLTLGTVTPEIVTVNYYSGDTLESTLYKIGHFSLVFTWLGAEVESPRFR